MKRPPRRRLRRTPAGRGTSPPEAEAASTMSPRRRGEQRERRDESADCRGREAPRQTGPHQAVDAAPDTAVPRRWARELVTFADLAEGRSALGRSLLSRRGLTLDWVPSFAAVPRAPFLPRVMWPYDMDTGTTLAVDQHKEPAAWYGYADADVPIVTQWDDGASDGPGIVSTSSASMPSVVFGMLRDLHVAAGHRVLEIGTGTGWNAALLAHRLGLNRVTSIEIDPQVADTARASLAAFGLPVTVVTADGTVGHPAAAPYDRIIATAGLRRIPLAWLSQTRPGGLIVAPWGTHYSHQDAVARLLVARDGESASGHFTSPVQFMKIRSQRLPFDGHHPYVPHGVDDADTSTTRVKEGELLAGGRFGVASFAVGLRVRDCWHAASERRGSARPVWFYGLSDRSWACVVFQEGEDSSVVFQSGARRLWDEVAEALRWWQAQGEPGYERFGLTVTNEGERAWLDQVPYSWKV
jgi:protein-L-isoaspartate O-methyltransferase